ncbi:MAG: four helix bundle protein [Deltaproteobacteria bacterium]|nr:four helix bundle protein [Deltaproteobacteria bacterium]
MSYNLFLESYRFSRRFIKDEIYGPISQIKRAAVSTPSNIT